MGRTRKLKKIKSWASAWLGLAEKGIRFGPRIAKVQEEGGALTWISRESGWDARTPVQVRSESLRAATPFAVLSAAAAAAEEEDEDEDEDEDGAATLPPLLAAAAAFFWAAFFLLASDTMAPIRETGELGVLGAWEAVAAAIGR